MTQPTTNVSPLSLLVQPCSVEGYELFYSGIHNRLPPEHVMGWIREIFAAWKRNRNVLNEAFRGSTKTTAVTKTLAAYLHGCFPHKTGLIVQVKDGSAQRNAQWIADTIEHNPVWKMFFPFVAPDKDRGWGKEQGFFLKRTDMDYGEWMRIANASEPSFIGYGYSSHAIIGTHPSLYLFVDDIIDREVAASSLEMANVAEAWSSTISYTRQPHDPLTVVSYTPWTKNDVYHKMDATGEFDHIRTPARLEDGSPTWPGGFDDEAIKKAEREDITGGVDAARMLYLDLARLANRVFQYQSYPHQHISLSWPMYGGSDPAGTLDPRTRTPDHSHFALAYLAKLPDGRGVVVDGVLEQCSPAEGETYLVQAQSMFPWWEHTSVEGDGAGTTFVSMSMRNPGLKLLPTTTRGVSKKDRIVRLLSPAFKFMRLLVSDADTKFLRNLRDFLNTYPNVDEHHPGWDAADSVVWAIVGGIPEINAVSEFEVNTGTVGPALVKKNKRQPNPWAALGRVGT